MTDSCKFFQVSDHKKRLDFVHLKQHLLDQDDARAVHKMLNVDATYGAGITLNNQEGVSCNTVQYLLTITLLCLAYIGPGNDGTLFGWYISIPG